ncbi:MAG: hypothetical protein RJA99_3344 [Pseudomonadota bacterium]
MQTLSAAAWSQTSRPAGFAPDAAATAEREDLRLQILADEQSAERSRLERARARLQERTAAGDATGASEARIAIERHETALASLGRELARVGASAKAAGPPSGAPFYAGRTRPAAQTHVSARSGVQQALATGSPGQEATGPRALWWDVYAPVGLIPAASPPDAPVLPAKTPIRP